MCRGVFVKSCQVCLLQSARLIEKVSTCGQTSTYFRQTGVFSSAENLSFESLPVFCIKQTIKGCFLKKC